MLRPHTFNQLTPCSLSFVTKSGPPIKAQAGSVRLLKTLRGSWAYGDIMGVCITFTSKTQARATAYFPNLSQPSCPYSTMCPVAALLNVFNKGWLTSGFLKLYGKGDRFKTSLKTLTTWKSPQASARYYREKPKALLRKIRRFCNGLPKPSEIYYRLMVFRLHSFKQVWR